MQKKNPQKTWQFISFTSCRNVVYITKLRHNRSLRSVTQTSSSSHPNLWSKSRGRNEGTRYIFFFFQTEALHVIPFGDSTSGNRNTLILPSSLGFQRETLILFEAATRASTREDLLNINVHYLFIWETVFRWNFNHILSCFYGKFIYYN